MGQAVTIFSFPYGDDGSDVEATAAALGQAGYRAAFLYGGGSEPVPPASCYRPSLLAAGADTVLLAILRQEGTNRSSVKTKSILRHNHTKDARSMARPPSSPS